MCRLYTIVYWCAHTTPEARICPRSIAYNQNCCTRTDHIIHLPSFCSNCISAPTFPDPQQASLIAPSTQEEPDEATLLWSRFHRLLFGEPIMDSNRGYHEHFRPQLLVSLPSRDIDSCISWLRLLQCSRRTPESWGKSDENFQDHSWDKIILLQILRTVVRYVVNSDEIRLHALDQEARRQLLAPVNSTDLEEDKHECPICTEEYGVDGAVDEEPENAVTLPCGHCFGEFCIKRALEELGWKCPFCRVTFSRVQYGLSSTLVSNALELPEIVESPWWMEWLLQPEE
ncbi:hypothetical protein BDZ45DRAFT_757358 [Acephala macrosclerotiorum]|nr:hypothetical protein BDZ45DRAFT_757358 [Acephala macrosclerotiorum]